MNQEENQQQEGNWGLPRGLYTQVKVLRCSDNESLYYSREFCFPLQFRDIFSLEGRS